MSNLTSIQNLIEKAADYMYRSKICEEDHISHAGRRSYVLQLLAWLEKRAPNRANVNRIERIVFDLQKSIGRNKDDQTVINPGSQFRRNYSTNGIDCGIFVDSFYSASDLTPQRTSELEKSVNKIATGFLVNNILHNRNCHNQYLWSCTGLANWLGHNEDKDLKQVLERTIEHWINQNENDGFTPYINNLPTLRGITPYYFSRCIAFAWYSMEKASIGRPDLEDKLAQAAYFLVKLFKPNGLKEIALEAKRYYFTGTHESGSTPYDIYVFYKMYQMTQNNFWIQIARHSFKHLKDSQLPNGAISGWNSNRKDWQCSIMRTGHLAWLTKIDDSFLEEVSKEPKELVLPTEYFSDKNSRLLMLGSEKKWVHFLTKKSPVNGYSGERSIGLIVPGTQNINNLFKKVPFNYRRPGNPIKFIKNNIKEIEMTIKHCLYHAYDYLIHKKMPTMTFEVLWNNLFGYLLIGMFVRSTEFPIEISNIKFEGNKIMHDMEIADLGGNQKEKIGTRIIECNREIVKITDTVGEKIKKSVYNL